MNHIRYNILYNKLVVCRIPIYIIKLLIICNNLFVTFNLEFATKETKIKILNPADENNI